jgi:hypothetical protein
MAEQAQPNRALAGNELRKIIMKDVENILDGDGMLASHIAYKKVSYAVTIKIMTDNPMLMGGSWTLRANAKPGSIQQIEDTPGMAAVQTFPLAGKLSEEHLESGIERTREIISPNRSRIQNGLPITITSRGADGEVKEQQIEYEGDTLPDDDDPYADKVTDKELSESEITSAP